MYATAIPAGRLTIRAASDAMSCELWLDECLVRQYNSAAAAAQSVRRHRSGCDLIDAATAKLPDSIDAWQWISVLAKAPAGQPMFLVRATARTL